MTLRRVVRVAPVAPVAFLLSVAVATPTSAQTLNSATFVNGLAIEATTLDATTGSSFDRRFGMFSDLYYDRNRNEWWALGDRGPGGGTLPYETRMSRFTIDVDASTGAISNFKVVETVKFSLGGTALNGLAPNPVSSLNVSFDPEGIVVIPSTGNFLVSDEYGPSLYEINRQGQVVKQFTTPDNVLPKNAALGADYTFDGTTGFGKRNNRGLEGLAISPDGQFAYAVLQSAMNDEGAGSGTYSRIIKYDIATGKAVGQFAYQLDGATAGRGISALVALGDDKFLVIERNNRGIGIGAALATADKDVYEIDLKGATDVSNIKFTGGVKPAGVTLVSKSAQKIDLTANTLSALGNKVPEKWEGLAIGPQLAGGLYLILAGTDNDFSVTQNGSNVQFDEYLNMSEADPNAGATLCGLADAACAANATSQGRVLLPGVLHAYRASLTGYQPTVVPEPSSIALLAAGLAGLAVGHRRRRRR